MIYKIMIYVFYYKIILYFFNVDLSLYTLKIKKKSPKFFFLCFQEFNFFVAEVDNIILSLKSLAQNL